MSTGPEGGGEGGDGERADYTLRLAKLNLGKGLFVVERMLRAGIVLCRIGAWTCLRPHPRPWLGRGGLGVGRSWEGVRDYSIRFDLKAVHDEAKSRFVIRIGKDEAVLEYKETSPGVLDLNCTQVPEALRGKGVGKVLAQVHTSPSSPCLSHCTNSLQLVKVSDCLLNLCCS
jgi:hypothetical protein